MPKARYKQVVDSLAADIHSRKFRPGHRLPTHRQLASQHGMALATASRVYAELEAMGLVSSETGRGTFVREAALPPGLGIDQPAMTAEMVNLNFSIPALPQQGELLRVALRKLASSGDINSLLRYQPHGGRLSEREIIAKHLSKLGLQVDAAYVLFVSGAQHGLAVTTMAVFNPGDVLAIDALTYPGMKVLAESLGLELVAIPTLDSGPDLDVLERLCSRRRVRAVYTQPTVHNPLGWVLNMERRQQLVKLARQHDLILIEDAAYAFLEAEAPTPLAALAPERTIYVSGFSKSIATGLRVGFVTAPPAYIPLIERTIRATIWNTPAVMTAIVCDWIKDGTLARLESEKRQDAVIRQNIAAEVLGDLKYVGHPASYFLWIPLPEEVRADRVAKELLDNDISVSTAVPFATSVQVPHALRIAIGSVEFDVLRHALTKVKNVIEYHQYL
ncbi:PLP-dependent aminotransferase family protein [Photobacterium sp. TY1-4]|uniref:aminotransferase-like domain-containing protein n=1 Tax=Photobacterium sp. TY1-4 TaxID=2899122 RepID=UPI0021C1E2B0|nr:PLP-dependent aminotransferase family protein [Photobacterium sp. TY1-4]UXI04513.1 PLP-dependent aminotransferase family protein [Photobacterium sp. TY1-4]